MGRRALKMRLVVGAVLAGVCVTAGIATAALVTVQKTQNSTLGAILVSASGRTLYHDSSEAKNTVVCTGTCAKTWPPLLVAAGAKPIAEPGVSASLLGTVTRPDGKVQVTYRGLPLYLYSGDKKAGDVNGQGSGGLWHAIAPSGLVVTKTVKASSGGTTTTTTTGGTGKSSGSGSGSSSGSGSGSGTGSGSSGSSGSGTPTDCDANPGGYGCM